jgi:uncharacterized hydrophobic protein (TIGR00271 family)
VSSLRRATVAFLRAQDKLVFLLGNTPEGRAAIVSSMLRRDSSEVTAYWLQLVVSIGIATLGLVVGSAAVVIGAMLVAPLMGPIVGLAMGLAAGSPFLVLRAASRIGLSVVVAIAGAALVTLFLPFHELNEEILARTSPTVLDLITATFCALAGVYASVRPGSDTTTTAAGTSIGISLVPPLCASGYGVGTQAASIAGGALLLFLTNLVAIVVVGSLSFLAAGFNRVNVVSLEQDELARETSTAAIARELARRLSQLFASRWGPAMRFLMPLALLALVYVPLRRALDEVAWQVRVRASVQNALANEAQRVVQSRVRVERHTVEVLLVMVGKSMDADRVRARLDAEVREASGVTPRLEVLAVADASAVAGLESSLHLSKVAPVLVPQPRESEDAQLDRARRRLIESLSKLWPSESAGPPLAVDLGMESVGALRIRVVHIGRDLSHETREALQNGLKVSLGREVSVESVSVPREPILRDSSDVEFVARVASAVRVSGELRAIRVCVRRPGLSGRPSRTKTPELQLSETLDRILEGHPHVTSETGPIWSVSFSDGACPKDEKP